MDRRGEASSAAKRGVRAKVAAIDLGSLKGFAAAMPGRTRCEFVNKYGRILDLLDVQVDGLVISALVQFWNPVLHVFELPNVDITPTVEEYDSLLDIRVPKRCEVYQYHKHDLTLTLLHELLGVRLRNTDLMKIGAVTGLKRMSLEEHITNSIIGQKWDMVKPALALAVYGLVLFPFVSNMVDQAAIDVFHKMVKFNANPVPAILGETSLAMQACYQRRQEKIKCCTQLLYVWLVTHFNRRDYVKGALDPLMNFIKTPIRISTVDDWNRHFRMATPKTYYGVCPWLRLDNNNMFYKCEGFPHLPLMGPRGCISHIPALVLGQLGWAVRPVATEKMEDFAFWYADDKADKEVIEKIRSSWCQIDMLGVEDLGPRKVAILDEYVGWRQSRISGAPIPKAAPPKEEPSEKELKLLEKVQILEAQLKVLEERNEDALINEGRYKSEIRRMEREKESLKGVHADTYAGRKRGRREEEIDELTARVASQDHSLRLLSKQKNESEIMAKKFEQACKGLEEEVGDLKAALEANKEHSQRGWAQANEHQLLVSQLLHRETQLAAQISQLKIEAEYQELNAQNKVRVHDSEMSVLREQMRILSAAADKIRIDRHKWKEQCQTLISGLEDFSLLWLKDFNEAYQELHTHPRPQIPVRMKEFFREYRHLAEQLQEWKDCDPAQMQEKEEEEDPEEE